MAVFRPYAIYHFNCGLTLKMAPAPAGQETKAARQAGRLKARHLPVNEGRKVSNYEFERFNCRGRNFY
ncbi:hypothetical protein DPQ22_01365 [Candidatus Tokpelaia sp.]|nr:hypothetical protein DPQ22_01365 [Candidatus Tokpelaia sp.]